MLVVRAEVVDLATDVVKEDDTFLVDTNVWLWTTYSRASIDAKDYQVSAYPNYLKRVLERKATLVHCGLSLAELSHVIESIEHTLHKNIGGSCQGRKEFRQNTVCR